MISATDLGAEVELSDERESHIAETHPELLPRCKEQIGNTLKRIGSGVGSCFLIIRELRASDSGDVMRAIDK